MTDSGDYIDRNALSWWFPRIAAAGLPVPHTILLQMPRDAIESVLTIMDDPENGTVHPPLLRFFTALSDAACSIGLPAFLRTDHLSGKHRWKDSCLLPSGERAVVAAHFWSLIEQSECAGILGLPWNGWGVRELLPTRPIGTCTRYGDMPVCREFRCFAHDGKLRCLHPYWPRSAVEEGGAAGIDYDALSQLTDADRREVTRLATAASRAVGGAWSIDILETASGWFVIDMALAQDSWHWPKCPDAASQAR